MKARSEIVQNSQTIYNDSICIRNNDSEVVSDEEFHNKCMQMNSDATSH